MVTRKDVAEYAGVSVATVSYVINHTKKISPEVEERVKAAIETLGYRPNLVARSLATKQTNHVAMLTDNLKNPHNIMILEGAQAVANRNGYMISSMSIDHANQDAILNLVARGMNGYILFHSRKKEKLMDIFKNYYIVVTDEEDLRIDCREAIFAAIKSLKNHGHEKVAYLSGLSIKDEKKHYRLRDFKEAMQYYGLVMNERLIIDGNAENTTDEEAGMEAARRLLETKEEFTAVMAVNDLMAIGAIREFYLHGLRVPQDISIIGCDNIKETRYGVPTISTLDVKGTEHGQYLMEKLICRMEGKIFEPRVIRAEYIERESVADKRK